MSAPTLTKLGDGTVVECWHDGEFYRARAVTRGASFVRLDTVEARRAKVPRRHVHVLARTDSDVLVFEMCEKSAMVLHEFKRLCETKDAQP